MDDCIVLYETIVERGLVECCTSSCTLPSVCPELLSTYAAWLHPPEFPSIKPQREPTNQRASSKLIAVTSYGKGTEVQDGKVASSSCACRGACCAFPCPAAAPQPLTAQIRGRGILSYLAMRPSMQCGYITKQRPFPEIPAPFPGVGVEPFGAFFRPNPLSLRTC